MSVLSILWDNLTLIIILSSVVMVCQLLSSSYFTEITAIGALPVKIPIFQMRKARLTFE